MHHESRSMNHLQGVPLSLKYRNFQVKSPPPPSSPPKNHRRRTVSYTGEREHLPDCNGRAGTYRKVEECDEEGQFQTVDMP